MIFVLSPAKALDYDTPPATAQYSQPDLLAEAAELISVLRDYSPAQVAELMSLSDKLASLNAARFEAWAPPFTLDNAKQAVLAFNGDVYEGLDAASLSEAELLWAQDHLRILSGLYGVLRPLDLMQAYRLEMGTRLSTARGRNLYEFWGERITDQLNGLLQADRAQGGEGLLLNLASEEYFKSVQPHRLQGRLLEVRFEDWKTDRYKVISFHAKRARGLMARHLIQQRVKDEEGVRAFAAEGYLYEPAASSAERLVFRRRR